MCLDLFLITEMGGMGSKVVKTETPVDGVQPQVREIQSCNIFYIEMQKHNSPISKRMIELLDYIVFFELLEAS